MDKAVKTTADAESFEQFKAIRHGEKKEPPAPATEKKEPPTTQPSDKGSESAAVSETAETKTNQEEEKPKRDRSLEGRVKELRTAGKHEEADKILRDAWTKEEKSRADRLEEELRTLRTRKPEPETKPAPAETPKPAAEAKAHPDDEPMPKIDDPKYQVAGGYEQYLEDRALTRWRNEQRGIERQKRDLDFRGRVTAALNAGRAAHADFDAVANTVQINKQVFQDAFGRLENIGEVLYRIGSEPGEAARIAALDPIDQYAELRFISRQLAKPAPVAAPIPEETKLKPAVTKAAPPPRSLSGGRDDGEKPTLSEARDYDDFKRIKRLRSA